MLFNAATFASILALASAAPLRASKEAADPPITGPGILLSNQGTLETKYCFYNNFWNGVGTAGANYDHPDQCVTLPSGHKKFVQLPKEFKGRVQRTDLKLLQTWAEFQLCDTAGIGWGDISVQQGCDGPATIESTDGTKNVAGFDHQIVHKAPKAATTQRSDGQTVLAGTMGSWLGGPNQAAIDYLNKAIDVTKTYVTGGSGVKVVTSKNNAFKVTFY